MFTVGEKIGEGRKGETGLIKNDCEQMQSYPLKFSGDEVLSRKTVKQCFVSMYAVSRQRQP